MELTDLEHHPLADKYILYAYLYGGVELVKRALIQTWKALLEKQSFSALRKHLVGLNDSLQN